MKVFISQPMGGLSEVQIRENRKIAEADIRKKYGEDVEIIDSFFEDYCPSKGHIALKFLAKSLELLADADLAYFCDGYKCARGCLIEWICANQYGIRVDYETNPNKDGDSKENIDSRAIFDDEIFKFGLNCSRYGLRKML
jgi:hypothetical protein